MKMIVLTNKTISNASIDKTATMYTTPRITMATHEYGEFTVTATLTYKYEIDTELVDIKNKITNVIEGINQAELLYVHFASNSIITIDDIAYSSIRISLYRADGEFHTSIDGDREGDSLPIILYSDYNGITDTAKKIISETLSKDIINYCKENGRMILNMYKSLHIELISNELNKFKTEIEHCCDLATNSNDQ